MSEIPHETSPRKLVAASGAAAVGAAAILALFVLPAERGIDVTGLGGLLGLTGMAEGVHMIFRWEATGPVKADMHGEPPNAGVEEFSTYWKEADLTTGQGAFTAPFEGIHGWYWRNRGETTVTVKVRTNGFYQTLFRPPSE